MLPKSLGQCFSYLDMHTSNTLVLLLLVSAFDVLFISKRCVVPLEAEVSSDTASGTTEVYQT